jgi:hypothetical protein
MVKIKFKLPKLKFKLRVTLPPNKVHIPRTCYNRQVAKQELRKEVGRYA